LNTTLVPFRPLVSEVSAAVFALPSTQRDVYGFLIRLVGEQSDAEKSSPMRNDVDLLTRRAERAAAMVARTYGVLVGSIKAGRLDPAGTSPHYQIWVVAGSDNDRVAVNVRSVDGSEVLVHYDPAYTLPTKRDLPALAAGPPGFTALVTGPNGTGLDYLRDGLFPIAEMQPLAPDGTGTTLQNLLDAQIQRAVADSSAVAIVFGDGFIDLGTDSTFGFTPADGVHDIHMMQGNGGEYTSENRINGDGALFIRFSDGTTTALFVRFATQSTSTDDTGAPTPPK
jgi:uncharacterized protein YukJ